MKIQNHHAMTHHAATLTRAAHGVALPLDLNEAGTAPEWIELIPSGTFTGRDGRGPYTLDIDAVLLAFANNAIDLPIDYEHQSMSAADKTGPVPAAGWITALEVREGALWGQVRWTARAAELVSRHEYRFISPVFRHDQHGRVLALAGAGLTHYPNLDLNPVAHAEGDPMNEFLAQLAALLGLPAGASDEEVTKAIVALLENPPAPEAAMNAQKIDPAAFVPMSQHQAVATQLATLQARLADEQAEAAVSSAMHSGKLAPAMQPWALDFARKDAEGFAQWVKTAPVILPMGQTSHAQHVASNVHTLSDEEREACSLLGLSASEFAAHKAKMTTTTT